MIGKIYLLPNTLGESEPNNVIPQPVINKTIELRYFIVENTRTTRRFLRKLDSEFPIDSSLFFELNKHTNNKEMETFLAPCLRGQDMGIMSEAGVPGVADPGADVVALAHEKGIQVVPLVGPSSILLAVMASGLNGQNFAFNGYLPLKTPERIKRLKELEKRSRNEMQSQLFIETPYRNNAMMQDILNSCMPETKITIAADITLETEEIKTKTVNDWKKNPIELNKRPAIFIIQS